MSAPRPLNLTLAEAADAEFWRRLSPDLSIEREAPTPEAALPDLERLHGLIMTEGYVHEPDVLPRALVDRLFACIQRLQERGIPPAFVFVYDEAWLLFRSLAPFVRRVLGEDYRILPAFWAWYVEPSDQAAGWPPHRDRLHSIEADNTPQSISIWLPLSHATPLNGCMYVLPMPLDETLQKRAFGQQPMTFGPDTVQNIRALPATPGSLLAWNQCLLHWGGRASRLGSGPRCSLSVEFQRGDRPALEKGLIDPRQNLPFAARLGLLGRLVQRYARFSPLNSPELRLLAVGLAWKYQSR